MNRETYLKENRMGSISSIQIFHSDPWGHVPYEKTKWQFRLEWISYMATGAIFGAIFGIIGVVIKFALGEIAAGLFAAVVSWLYTSQWRSIKEKRIITINDLSFDIGMVLILVIISIFFSLT